MNPEPNQVLPRAVAKRLVELDGVRNDDIPILCRWMNDPDDLSMWTGRKRLLPYEDLARLIRESSRTGLFTVVRNATTGDPIGYLDGNVRVQDAVAEFQVYMARESRHLRGALALYLFLEYLFSSYPLRKVYCRVYEYNRASLNLAQKVGFVEEGRFSSHVFWHDRYWDMCILSADRATWERAQLGQGPGGLALVRLARQVRARSEKAPL